MGAQRVAPTPTGAGAGGCISSTAALRRPRCWSPAYSVRRRVADGLALLPAPLVHRGRHVGWLRYPCPCGCGSQWEMAKSLHDTGRTHVGKLHVPIRPHHMHPFMQNIQTITSTPPQSSRLAHWSNTWLVQFIKSAQVPWPPTPPGYPSDILILPS